MAYYLRHYFDPGFNHEQLKPQILKDGEASHYYLEYVHNVVAGQVLAEVVDLAKHPGYPVEDKNFVFQEKIFPCGSNCEPHPDFPERILAKISGYVFYNNGLINVKHLLNVRHDIDFHTGNIIFIGDVVAHQAVRTGFTLLGKNVLVKGTLEGATIIAGQNIVCESGVKGVGHGFLRCGGNVRVPFCENITIYAAGNVEISGSCLHSEIYAGGSVMIKGRLQGGTTYARDVVYVAEQAGGGYNTVTKVGLGYPPIDVRTLHRLQDETLHLRERLTSLEVQAHRKTDLAEHNSPLIRLFNEKLRLKHEAISQLSANLRMAEENASKCRLICKGKVRPGLAVSIAQASTEVYDSYEHGLELHMRDNEIAYKPL